MIVSNNIQDKFTDLNNNLHALNFWFKERQPDLSPEKSFWTLHQSDYNSLTPTQLYRFMRVVPY